jgi:hypothetical protein
MNKMLSHSNNFSTSNCSPEQVSDFFLPLFVNHWYKILFMTFTIISIPVNFALLSGIIWYERYGIDAKRTIVNKLFFFEFWTAIQFTALTIIPDIIRYNTGPCTELICWLHLMLKNMIGSEFLLILTTTIVLRYICIFVLKNLTGFKDGFWNIFLIIWIEGFSFITQLVFALIPGRNSNTYYICLRKSPPEAPPKTNYPILTIIFLGSDIHIFCSIRIFLYKNDIKQNDLKSIRTFIINNSLIASWEKHSLPDFTTNTLIILSLLETLFLLQAIGTLKPHELNVYPNTLILNWLQIANFEIVLLIMLLLYYCR